MALVSKAFGDIITFTRASSATFTNSSGLIELAATDEPRFDYDPVTLAPKGLLIEEARTNLHLYSQDFSTGWTNTGGAAATLTAAAATAPDGTTTAGSFLCADTTDAQRRLYASANITVSVSTAYTASIYVKPVNGWQWVSFAVSGGTSVGSGMGGVTFDLTNGIVGTSIQPASGASLTAYSITAVGNGWFRLVVSGVQDTTATSLRPKVILLDADEGMAGTAVGVVGAGVYVWGAQLEQAAFPTSYITTTSAQTTRAADNAVMTGTNFSSFYNQTEGTFVVSASNPASGTRTSLGINDTTANEVLRLYSSGTDPKFIVIDGGATQADIDAGAITANTVFKLASAYKVNDFAVSVNGGAVQTDTSGTIPTVTQAQLGVGTGTNYLNGHIQRITYYPRRLTDAELEAITT